MNYVWQCEFCQACTTSDGQDVKDPQLIEQACDEGRLEDTTCEDCWNRIQVGDL